MSYAIPSSPDEKRWQAKEDAWNLAEVERIKEDPTRLAAAQAMAKQMADEDSKRIVAMRKVAQKTTPTTGSAKRVVKKPPKGPDSFTNVKGIRNLLGKI